MVFSFLIKERKIPENFLTTILFDVQVVKKNLFCIGARRPVFMSE